ncbi:MAG: RNA polymerase-associated protein RapA [Gammaproteobacteria bacterium]
MSDPVFVPGQRWVSNTESELGLGIVVENENRRVTLSFPAAGERRVYATDNAPLSRVIYNIGETIADDEGLTIKIQQRHDNNGCIIYGGATADGEPAVIAELNLDSFVQFSRPLDRLFAGQIDKNNSFILRTETLGHQHRHARSSAYGLLGPRVQLLPHQFYIAQQVAARYHPRVLLADEVGLGKTIEAGLIVHQQLLCGRAQRVLIIVPDSLVHQWLVEMLRRFNLHFTILDEETCSAIEDGGDEDAEETPGEEPQNPFDSAQFVLAGLSLLVDNPARREQALAASWDLMVVDEAHHLSWHEDAVSPAYAAVEALARAAAGLILITATPEQLGVEGHFARLRLLDPDRYHDLAEFRAEEERYRPVAELIAALRDADPATGFKRDDELPRRLAEFLDPAAITALVDAQPDARCGLIDDAVRNLLDRQGTGRVLYRNCRDTVAGFPKRELHAYVLAPPAAYVAAAAAATIEQRLLPESVLGDAWIASDPRVAWLVDWLAQHRGEKVLVICAHAATAIALEEHLRVRGGIRSAVFHEGLGLVQRDRAAAYFADEQDNAETLICSEIGSEGRNFQFAHHLVLFDLPLNPDLLEQRIGRLDRIGQRHTVKIHVPVLEQTAGAVLLRWFHEGLDAFESVFPAGRILFDEFEQSLRECLAAPTDTAAIDQLVAATRAHALETREVLSRGRDQLLELNSYDDDQAMSVIEALSEAARKLELADYMEGVFDFFGVDQQPHGPLSVVVHPSDQMLCHSFPGLPEGGITGTYERGEALTHEDMHFLTWEHPMVTGAMDMMLSGEFGNSTLCALKAPFLKPGTLLLEAIFVVSCPGPRHLQLSRYLPQASLRIVVDRDRRDLTQILTADRIDGIIETLKKHVAQEVAKHARAEIMAMAKRAEEIAEATLGGLLGEAIAAARDEQAAELARLEALATVNPNIRAEEIEFRRDYAITLVEILGNATVRLDAVRVGLAT